MPEFRRGKGTSLASPCRSLGSPKKQGLRLYLIHPSARNGAPRIQILTFTCDLSVSGLRTSDRLNKCFRVLEQFWHQLHDGPLLSLGGIKPNQSQTSFKIYEHSTWDADGANGQPGGASLPFTNPPNDLTLPSCILQKMLTESINIYEEPMTATAPSGDTQENQKDTEWNFVLIVQILHRKPHAGVHQVPLQRGQP